jgi:hypothetical protein
MLPDRVEAWCWLYAALTPWLKIDKKREATMIRRGWDNMTNHPFPTLEDARALAKADAETLRYI